MKLVGLYTRVSSVKQLKNEGSLETQADVLQSFVTARQKQGLETEEEGWKVVGTYREEGRSAKDTCRPELQRLLNDIRLGIVNTIVVTKIDRITRNLNDFLDLWRLFEQHNVDFISLAESIDTSTPMGKAMTRIIVIFAEMERETTAARVQAKTDWRKEQGLYVGAPPLGYDFNPERRGELIVNPEEAAIVHHIYETYLKVGSILQTTVVINSEGYRTKTYTSKRSLPVGGTPFMHKAINRVLGNPTYVGYIEHGKKLVEGKHEAILPRDLWDRVQRRLKTQVRTRHNEATERQYAFLVEGIIKCGACGGAMTPRWATGRHHLKYFYYDCVSRNHFGRAACSMKAIPAPAFDQAFIERLKEIGEQRAYVKNLTRQAGVTAKYELEQLEMRRNTLEMQRAQLARKVQRWTDLLTASKAYGAEEHLLKQIGKATQEDEALSAQLEELAHQKDELSCRVPDTEGVITNLRTFSELVDNATDDEKKSLVRLIVHQIIWTTEEVKYALYDHPSEDVLNSLGNGSNGGSPLLTKKWTTWKTQRTAILWTADNYCIQQTKKGHRILMCNNGLTI